MNKMYQVVDRDTEQPLTPYPTFNRDVARVFKQQLKQQGLDVVIKASKVQLTNTQTIR
jgi:hypothetical protein